MVDWDPFADPADDPAAVAEAEQWAATRGGGAGLRFAGDEPSDEGSDDAGEESATDALTLFRGTPAQRLEQRERQETLAKLGAIDVVTEWPLLALEAAEVYAASFVLASTPVDVVHGLEQLRGDSLEGVRVERHAGNVFLAHHADGSVHLMEPVPALELAKDGPRHVSGARCYSKATLHTVARFRSRGGELPVAPQVDDVRQSYDKEYSYREYRDFCRFAPGTQNAPERTLLRRSVGGLQVARGDYHDLVRRLSQSFEAENRRWVSKFAPAAIEGAPAGVPAAAGDPNGGSSRGADGAPQHGASSAAVPANKGAAALTLEQALEMQDLLIAEYSKVEFQVRLHTGWARSADEMQRLRARRDACFPIQGPIIQQFGFEPTQRGVHQSVRAFSAHNSHPEVARKNLVMNYLVNPPEQDLEFIEKNLGCVYASCELYSALRLPALYKPDKELVALAKSGAANKLRFRIDENMSDPNIVVPDHLGYLNEARTRFYFIEERTPLIAAIETGQHTVFRVLLSYRPLVDTNVVCLEWSLGDAYKQYTALDVGRRCEKSEKHEFAAAMVKQLIAAGAKSADEMPTPERQNPFLTWREHFPDGKLDRIGTEFAYEGTAGGPSYSSGPEPRLPPGPRGGAPPGPASPPRVAPGSRWKFPPAPSDATPEINAILADIRQRLDDSGGNAAPDDDSKDQQQRLLRQLFLEWHPDKRPSEQELATKIFQWLQGVKGSSA